MKWFVICVKIRRRISWWKAGVYNKAGTEPLIRVMIEGKDQEYITGRGRIGKR